MITKAVVLSGILLSGALPMTAVQASNRGQDALAQVVAPVGSEQNPAQVSGEVVAGSILHQPVPHVPKEILQQHLSGSVVMAVVIDPEGNVVSVKPISGPQQLREPYMAAVRRWTYKPFLLHGLPVYVQKAVTVHICYGAL